MKKQLTILLILIFALGFTPISINKITTVLAYECPPTYFNAFKNSYANNIYVFKNDEEITLNSGEGFGETPGNVKFTVISGGEEEGIIISWTTSEIVVRTPKLLQGGKLVVATNCGGYYTEDYISYNQYYGIPTIYYLAPTIIYPGSEVKIVGGYLNVSAYAKEGVQVKINGKSIFLDVKKIDGNISFYLPKDTPVGSNYVEVINENQKMSDKFYFKVSKHDCVASDWKCNSWSICNVDGTQTRECNLISDCENSNAVKPNISQSCIPQCREDKWKCGEWGSCSASGQQTRICIKDYDCPLIDSQSPATTQSCAYTPACSVDTWQCGNWGTCSPQGVQTRSCTRTYDCPSAETAAPATSQYCVAPNQPKQQSPTEDLGIVNQDSIIKSTVKLICPVSSTMASQGSGTVINSTGLILTNKHVIDGTAGCWVGFIDNYNDEPYFGDRQIADIYKISSDADAAVLKLRNPSNKTLTSINISQSNSGSIKLGETLTTYGYPAKFGTKITYTSGDFSGVDGNYLKTTAIIEHGNSGGGAYLKNGSFIGIPTAVIKGSLNSMGYLLSVNKVNSWLNNSIAYNYNSNNNNYSRVSAILDNMDLSALGSLGLFITGDEANIKTATESQTVIAEEKKLITKIDNKLSKRISGNILLQVEKNGEGWYVYPDDKKKYYLGRPADAFSIMRNLGLGIKHSELAGYLNTKFLSRLSGKIMLDVEQNGEAYYIYPKNLKGYFLSRPSDAFKVMRDLGLGITNADIRKIGVGEIK